MTDPYITLISSIASGLRQYATRNDEIIRAEFACVGPISNLKIWSRLSDSDEHPVALSVVPDGELALTGLLRELRTMTAQPRSGAWLSLTFTAVSEQEHESLWNFDEEPDLPGVTAKQWAQDLAQFPRWPQDIPDWLNAKISGAAT